MSSHRISAHPLAVLATATLLVAACAAKEESTAADAAEPATEAADHAAHDGAGPRVFFVGLEDGATVPTNLQLEFGAENFTIEPVGDGMVHAGAGHYHVGLDTDCLPAGEVIPTADPWIHFGNGSSTIEMPLSPGEHTLVLQIGDGEHRTLPDPGLCHVIRVNAVEEPAS